MPQIWAPKSQIGTYRYMIKHINPISKMPTNMAHYTERLFPHVLKRSHDRSLLFFVSLLSLKFYSCFYSLLTSQFSLKYVFCSSLSFLLYNFISSSLIVFCLHSHDLLLLSLSLSLVFFSISIFLSLLCYFQSNLKPKLTRQ